jgi:type II secretory pathway pseudopilin PulG
MSISKKIKNIFLFRISSFGFRVSAKAGFSYAELMVVIVLVVVTSLGTTLSLIRFYRVQEPRIAVRAIAAVLRDAAGRSAAQQNGAYWGVRFDNLAGRDRYVLFSATTPALLGYATSSVTYMGSATQFSEPADSSTVVFDKITGNALIAGCPATASSTITVSGVSVHIYCNGKIE